MNRLTATTSWLIVGTGLLLAFAYPSEASEKELQGRRGDDADDVQREDETTDSRLTL